MKLTIIVPHLLGTVNWSSSRRVTTTKQEPSQGVHPGAGTGNALPSRRCCEGQGNTHQMPHLPQSRRSQSVIKEQRGVEVWVSECWDIPESAASLPCSLLCKPVNSFLLAWFGILSLATQSVPNNQKPEVIETYTCQSKRKHLLLVINLWNESHWTVQDCIPNAAWRFTGMRWVFIGH